MTNKIEELLRNISLPRRYFDSKFNISDKFEEEMSRFISLVENCQECATKGGYTHIVPKIQDVIEVANKASDIISKIFVCYNRSDFSEAQKQMDELMELLKKYLFIGSIYGFVNVDLNGKTNYMRFRNGSYDRFFRVRPVDCKNQNIEDDPDELFHVPFSKRSKISTQRFSLAGFPALYLSTMLQTAWEECDYPQKYYYSVYVYNNSDDELKLIQIYSPTEMVEWGCALKYNDFELWFEVITRYLKNYPLILACSFVNQSGKEAAFKQEYIIPQLLMQWIHRNNTVVQGVGYFTCIDCFTSTNGWSSYNIAIPAMEPFDEKTFSVPLRQAFKWTSPQFYEVSIFDIKISKSDREFVYNFILESDTIIYNHIISSKYRNKISEAKTICSGLLNLFENGSNMSLHSVLDLLFSFSLNINEIVKNCTHEEIETDIKSENKSLLEKIVTLNELNFTIDNYLLFVERLKNSNANSNNIYEIIEKYEGMCWFDG